MLCCNCITMWCVMRRMAHGLLDDNLITVVAIMYRNVQSLWFKINEDEEIF